MLAIFQYVHRVLNSYDYSGSWLQQKKASRELLKKRVDILIYIIHMG